MLSSLQNHESLYEISEQNESSQLAYSSMQHREIHNRVLNALPVLQVVKGYQWSFVIISKPKYKEHEPTKEERIKIKICQVLTKNDRVH